MYDYFCTQIADDGRHARVYYIEDEKNLITLL